MITRANKFLYSLATLAGFCLLLTVGVALYAWDYYEGEGPKAEGSVIIFKRGDGFHEIVGQMAQSGVIEHPLFFKAIAVLSGDARRFKAGEYNFPAGVSPRIAMDMLAEGQVVAHKITIAEGLKAADVVQFIANEPTLEGSVPTDIKEGSLLPETYHFIYGDSRADVINRMRESMYKTLDELWATRREGLPIVSKEEALILASIVEKETGLPAERGRVAAVFINRLKKNMRLQSDPTTAYGLGKSGTQLTSADLQSNTPYNTYVIDRLPPTPIANPGREAIAAVLNPPDTNDLYFVATGTGGHTFSETLKSHNRSVVEYRKVVKEKKKRPKKS